MFILTGDYPYVSTQPPNIVYPTALLHYAVRGWFYCSRSKLRLGLLLAFSILIPLAQNAVNGVSQFLKDIGFAQECLGQFGMLAGQRMSFACSRWKGSLE